MFPYRNCTIWMDLTTHLFHLQEKQFGHQESQVGTQNTAQADLYGEEER